MAKRKAPVVWFELPVSDFARAEAFYGGLFGWTFDPIDSGGRPYRLIDAGDRSIGGGLSLREGPAPGGTGPLVYVQVADVEVAIIRAQRLGGELVRRPTFLSSEAGVAATVRDPEGNEVGLWAPE